MHLTPFIPGQAPCGPDGCPLSWAAPAASVPEGAPIPMTLPAGTPISWMSYAGPTGKTVAMVTVQEHHGVGYPIPGGVFFRFDDTCFNFAVVHPLPETFHAAPEGRHADWLDHDPVAGGRGSLDAAGLALAGVHGGGVTVYETVTLHERPVEPPHGPAAPIPLPPSLALLCAALAALLWRKTCLST